MPQREQKFSLGVDLYYQDDATGLFPLKCTKSSCIKVSTAFYVVHSEIALSYDVAVIQWITSCHKNLIYVMSLTCQQCVFTLN